MAECTYQIRKVVGYVLVLTPVEHRRLNGVLRQALRELPLRASRTTIEDILHALDAPTVEDV